MTNDIYIGQSKDLSKRFIKYFNLSYLRDRNSLIISRALIKYGYSNFSLEILEYCDEAELLIREQYYFDKLNPKYNILKVAGSSLNYNHTKETKAKISEALKGVYVKEKSPLFGKVHTKETKALMSLKKIKENTGREEREGKERGGKGRGRRGREGRRGGLERVNAGHARTGHSFVHLNPARCGTISCLCLFGFFESAFVLMCG